MYNSIDREYSCDTVISWKACRTLLFANTWPQFLVSVNNEACLLIPFSRCPPLYLSPAPPLPLSLSFSTSEVLFSVSSFNAPQNSYMFSFSPPADSFLTSLFILLLERATIRVLLKITGRLRRSIIVKPAVSCRHDAATSHAPSTFPPYAVSPTALSCITATQSNTSLYGVPRKWSCNWRKEVNNRRKVILRAKINLNCTLKFVRKSLYFISFSFEQILFENWWNDSCSLACSKYFVISAYIFQSVSNLTNTIIIVVSRVNEISKCFIWHV